MTISDTNPVSSGVVISAPMSFTGSAQRIWHITRDHVGWAYAGMVTLAILAITLAWAAVLCWYPRHLPQTRSAAGPASPRPGRYDYRQPRPV